ncbi:hypothetical protein [Sphingomonas sp.]|uniref:hypothetical protein n=1 Tax=Sphingomonas sp. TaxID=28214 RepID=UPI003D6D7BEB
MTHSPPIPAGNQSPYPLQEPPHEHLPPLADASAGYDDDQSDDEGLVAGIGNKALGIGAAVGIGSAAIVAGLLYARSSGTAAKSKSGAKPGTAARKPAAAKPGTGSRKVKA